MLSLVTQKGQAKPDELGHTCVGVDQSSNCTESAARKEQGQNKLGHTHVDQSSTSTKSTARKGQSQNTEYTQSRYQLGEARAHTR